MKPVLAVMIPMTGMDGAELLLPRRHLAQLEILRAANDAMARDLAELNAHAYQMPADAFECISNMRLWYAGYVGYLDGTPVSCPPTLPVAEPST